MFVAGGVREWAHDGEAAGEHLVGDVIEPLAGEDHVRGGKARVSCWDGLPPVRAAAAFPALRFHVGGDRIGDGFLAGRLSVARDREVEIKR